MEWFLLLLLLYHLAAVQPIWFDFMETACALRLNASPLPLTLQPKNALLFFPKLQHTRIYFHIKLDKWKLSSIRMFYVVRHYLCDAPQRERPMESEESLFI